MDGGISFNGRHISELGAVFLISKWPSSAAVTINDASVPGRDGTIRYAGQTFAEKTLDGKLYLLDPDDALMSYTQMMQRADDVTEWLQPGGRKRLVLDATPDRFYMAEVEHALEFTTDEWENGAASVKFTLQPFSYSEITDAISYTLAANVEQAKTLTLRGNRPAPVMVTITAAAAISWVQLTVGAKVLRLEGMSLASGDVLTIDASLDLSELMTVKIGSTPARGYITAASSCPFEAQPGSNTVKAKASGACAVSVCARGRWK